jgi:hypothetical protein
MRKRVIAGVACAAVLAAGVLAGMSLAREDGVAEPRDVADVVVAKPVTGVASEAARAKRKRRGPVIDFFYSPTVLVPTDEASVQPIRCPRRAGNPIAGGARTSQGIVIAYLSRAHPLTGNTPPRTYFVGAEDVSESNPPDSGALVEVQCAKGMRVRN